MGLRLDYNKGGKTFIYRMTSYPVIYLNVMNHWGRLDYMKFKELRPDIAGEAFIKYVRKMVGIPDRVKDLLLFDEVQEKKEYNPFTD
jgi:hypothetical protein